MYEYNGQSVYPLSDVAAMFGVSAGLPNHWLKRGNYGLAEGKDYTIISGKVYKQLTGRNVSAKEPICVIYQSGIDKIKRFRSMTVSEDSNRENDNKKSGANYTVEGDELIKAASRLGAKNVQISRFFDRNRVSAFGGKHQVQKDRYWGIYAAGFMDRRRSENSRSPYGKRLHPSYDM